jgi:sigma-B regulation protein RsbU (phosphoserine phosphatase)
LTSSFPSLSRWWLYQLLYAVVALSVYSILWAVGQQSDALVVVLYAFGLGNLNTIAIDLMRPPLSRHRPAYDWVLFTAAETVQIPSFFLLTTAAGFLILGTAHMTPPFWRYVQTGWKMPVVMAFLFAVAYNFFRRASETMERRNQELQNAVEQELSGRELQEEDLERALEIQRALLPREISQVPGFQVVAAWQPARVVGGDYYDVIRLSDTKLAFCIADVVGKGVSAALLMANVQATVRAYASGEATPAWLCTRVNQVLCSNLADDKFVTFFYAVLDSETRMLSYANAGHVPPLLMKSTGQTLKLSEGGLVLGIFAGSSYEQREVALAPGDRLILITDGISEAMRADGEEFGETGVLQTLRSIKEDSPEEIKARLLAEVDRFCDSNFHDDATLLLVCADNAPEHTNTTRNLSENVPQSV